MPYVGHSNFGKGCRKKMCTRQSRKGGLHCSLLLLLSISAREHMSVASCAILSNFVVEQWRSKPSTIPFRIVARFSKQLYYCKYLAQFLSLNIFAARSVRYVLVTYSVSSQTRAFRFRYVTIMKFSERVWGKESRTGTRQVYGTLHSVVYPEFQCRS